MSSEWRAFLLGIVGVPLILAGLVVAVYGAETATILHRIWLRLPLLLSGSPDFSRFEGGFAANIMISLWSMLIAGVGGAVLGIGLISRSGIVRVPSELVMNILRNSPWLVVLYAMLYLLPFEVRVFGQTIFLSRGGIETAKNVGQRAHREILIELKD